MFKNGMSPILHYSNLTILHNRTVRCIILSGALLVAAIAVGTVIEVGDYRDRALADSERELNNTALILSEQIDRTFQAADLVESNLVQNIESLAIASEDDYALQMSGKDMNLKLKDKGSGLIQVDNILIVDSNGNLLNSSREWPTPTINVADRSYFRELKFDTQLPSVISQPLQGRISGAWTVFLARKVKAPDGAFRGLVIGAIELPYFETFFSSIALGDGGSIALYRSDGIVLARYPHKEAILGHIFAPVIEAFKDSNGGAIRFNTPLEGKDRLLAAHRIAHYPLLVSAAVDTDAALADWKNETEMLFGAAFGAVLAVALMFLLILRQVVQADGTSQNILSMEKQRLYTAINNMSQGLILFDSSERMVVCNGRYLAMYWLPGEVMKPGCTFREVLEHGQKTGSFSGEVEEYRSRLLTSLTACRPHEIEKETADGRSIRIVSCAVKGGGWVSTHEDTTELKRLERERHRDRAALRDSEQMAQEIIAGSLDGFIQINDADEVVEWNPTCASRNSLHGDK
jgi:PAS domain-containing protein